MSKFEAAVEIVIAAFAAMMVIGVPPYGGFLWILIAEVAGK
jgi:hypothetical protein